MSQEMNFEFEQNVLLEERIGKYDLLKGLKSSGEYGYENFSQFYDSFSAGVVHKNYDILCVVGEPVSGKSSVASNMIALLQEEDITVEYLPWYDCLKASALEGIIDRQKPFSEITPDEFKKTSEFLSIVLDEISLSHRQDIYTPHATVIDLVAMTVANTSKDIDRGTSAVVHAVEQHTGNILFAAGDPETRESGKRLRHEIREITVPDESFDSLLQRYSITKPRTKKASQILLEELKTGAPPEVVDRNEKELNQVMFEAYINGDIELPVSIESPEAFEEDPIFREMVITRRYMPFLAKNIFNIPEDRVFIGVNSDINGRARNKKGKIKRPGITEINYLRKKYPLITL